MAKRVYLAARDLVFRSKLGAVVAGRGGEVVRDEAGCDLAVIEIEMPGWEERVRSLRARSVPVVAFGPHVRADLLRLAREAGAVAVPNSRVVETLRDLL